MKQRARKAKPVSFEALPSKFVLQHFTIIEERISLQILDLEAGLAIYSCFQQPDATLNKAEFVYRIDDRQFTNKASPLSGRTDGQITGHDPVSRTVCLQNTGTTRHGAAAARQYASEAHKKLPAAHPKRISKTFSTGNND